MVHISDREAFLLSEEPVSAAKLRRGMPVTYVANEAAELATELQFQHVSILHPHRTTGVEMGMHARVGITRTAANFQCHRRPKDEVNHGNCQIAEI